MKAIPTFYNGTHFKSRLEADTAFLLDALGLRWQYEPQGFLLDDGTHYLPDFWLPDVETWMECRGYKTDKGDRQINLFREMIEADNKTQFFTLSPYGHDVLRVGQCSECLEWFIYSALGWWKCPFCKKSFRPEQLAECLDLSTDNNGLKLNDMTAREFASILRGDADD